MTTEEKRAHMLRVVEPSVRFWEKDEAQVQQWLDILRNGTEHYIDFAWDKCGFQHTVARPSDQRPQL